MQQIFIFSYYICDAPKDLDIHISLYLAKCINTAEHQWMASLQSTALRLFLKLTDYATAHFCSKTRL